jgi:hypothetical protein
MPESGRFRHCCFVLVAGMGAYAALAKYLKCEM